VAVDSSNNILVTGYNNIKDYLTVKYDENGNYLWNRTFDRGSDDEAYAIDVDLQNNAYITGRSNGTNWDYLTVKYDEDGNLIWNKTFDSGDKDEAWGVAIDSSGSVVIGGESYNGGDYDYLTIKYSRPTGPVYFTVIFPVHNNTGYNFSTIQEAIDNSTAGATITVDAVTLTENVNVNKSVNLIGAGVGLTIVQAANSNAPVFNVTANRVNISGFTVTGGGGVFLFGGGGVFLFNSNYSKIEDVNVSNNEYGILLYNSINNTISNNTASSNNKGIFLIFSSDSNTLTHNIASNNDYGIYLYYSDGNTLTDNTASLNYDYGIYLDSSSNNTIYHNNFINNTVQANDDGTNTWDSGYPSGGNYWSDWTLSDANGDGIVDLPYNIRGGVNRDRYPVTSLDGWLDIDPSKVVNASSPACLSGESYYTSIQSAVDANTGTSRIYVCEGNYTENVDVNSPVELIGAGMNVVTVNAKDSSDHVFNVTADWVNISGLTVTGATGSGKAGIYLNANYGNISDNNASDNDYGLRFEFSSNNTITNNFIFNNTRGVNLTNSSNNYIYNNFLKYQQRLR